MVSLLDCVSLTSGCSSVFDLLRSAGGFPIETSNFANVPPLALFPRRAQE
jgi:uncharacterized protein YceK